MPSIVDCAAAFPFAGEVIRMYEVGSVVLLGIEKHIEVEGMSCVNVVTLLVSGFRVKRLNLVPRATSSTDTVDRSGI